MDSLGKMVVGFLLWTVALVVFLSASNMDKAESLGQLQLVDGRLVPTPEQFQKQQTAKRVRFGAGMLFFTGVYFVYRGNRDRIERNIRIKLGEQGENED